MNHRELWTHIYGNIPLDEEGRTYEIHHKDGNHANNDISNLQCLSIKEHYNIHYKNGDYGACVLIAKRMNLPPNYISEIQKGKKRPGIGGVKKGTIPWNKGKSGYKLNFSEEGLKNKIKAVKNNARITDYNAKSIKWLYENKITIKNDKIGKIQKNGKIFTYERAFAIYFAEKFKVSDQYIYRIIKGKSKIV